MKSCNREADMKPDDFEQKLSRQPLRQAPPEWRAEILRAARAASAHAAVPAKPRLRDYLALLLWPSPRAWGALAAAWVVIVAANLAMNSGGPGRASSPAPMAGGSWRQQQRLMAELLNGAEMPERAKEPKVSPRSERTSGNSKFETRNSKEIRSPKSEWVCDYGSRKHPFALGLVVPPAGGSRACEGPYELLQAKARTTNTRREFSAASFEFRICFEFRISNFEFINPVSTEERIYG
jgi:hypothetical protein